MPSTDFLPFVYTLKMTTEQRVQTCLGLVLIAFTFVFYINAVGLLPTLTAVNSYGEHNGLIIGISFFCFSTAYLACAWFMSKGTRKLYADRVQVWSIVHIGLVDAIFGLSSMPLNVAILFFVGYAVSVVSSITVMVVVRKNYIQPLLEQGSPTYQTFVSVA